MYSIRTTSRFERDVKSCNKKHWNIEALKQAIINLSYSDEIPLALNYKDHALTGDFQGFRSLHIDSSPNPPKDKWVLMYEICDDEIHLVRTGSHEDVYGKS